MADRTGHVLLVVIWLSVSLAMLGCGGEPAPATSPPTQAAPAPPPTSPPPTQPPAPPSATATNPPPPPTATLTPTPTNPPVVIIEPSATPANACAGFAGAIEIQVLVGPAEAVGMEPVAVGSVPLATAGCDGACVVQGQGPIVYEGVQAHAWGTYSVSMNLQISVEGTCSGAPGAETLALTIVMSGEQLVSVKATGFSGDYPWSGTQTRDVVLPLQDGAGAMGEGWGVVLHLGS